VTRRSLAVVAAAACGALCACDAPDEALTPKRAPSPPVADAAPTTSDTTGDAGPPLLADAPYDAGYPDGADASVPAPIYVVTDDTVLDPTNHLMWQRNETGHYFETPPTDYCARLTIGGYSDWRPATMVELTTLLIRQPRCPLLDHAAFPAALCDFYVSADIPNGDLYNPAMLDFATGVTKHLQETGGIYFFSSRCVRTSRDDVSL
jgi:hypothetical protein